MLHAKRKIYVSTRARTEKWENRYLSDSSFYSSMSTIFTRISLTRFVPWRRTITYIDFSIANQLLSMFLSIKISLVQNTHLYCIQMEKFIEWQTFEKIVAQQALRIVGSNSFAIIIRRKEKLRWFLRFQTRLMQHRSSRRWNLARSLLLGSYTLLD